METSQQIWSISNHVYASNASKNLWREYFQNIFTPKPLSSLYCSHSWWIISSSVMYPEMLPLHTQTFSFGHKLHWVHPNTYSFLIDDNVPFEIMKPIWVWKTTHHCDLLLQWVAVVALAFPFTSHHTSAWASGLKQNPNWKPSKALTPNVKLMLTSATQNILTKKGLWSLI